MRRRQLNDTMTGKLKRAGNKFLQFALAGRIDRAGKVHAGFMKNRAARYATCLLLASAAAGFSAKAQEVFQIDGVVSLSVNNANDFGIASGDAFTGTLTYNPSGSGYAIQGSSGPTSYGLGMGLLPFLNFTVQGQDFNVYANQLFVYHGSGGPDTISTTWPMHEPT